MADKCEKYIGRFVIVHGIIKEVQVHKEGNDTYTALYMYGKTAQKPLLLIVKNYEYHFFNRSPKDFIGKILDATVTIRQDDGKLFAWFSNRGQIATGDGLKMYKWGK